MGRIPRLLKPKLLLIKSLWLLTSLAGNCHGQASAKQLGRESDGVVRELITQT